MAIISLFNIKGGVGKTTSAVNLAALSALEGKSTLLIDLDPQSSVGFQLRVEAKPDVEVSNYLSSAKRLSRDIRSSYVPNLDVLASTLEIRSLVRLLDDEKHPRKHFRDILVDLAKGYDRVFIDNPPSVSIEVENVLRASDLIVVPAIASVLSINAFESARSFFRESKIPEETVRLFFSQVDTRKKLQQQVIDKARNDYSYVLHSWIPLRAEVEKCLEARQILVVDRPKTESALAYRVLWQELNQKKLVNESERLEHQEPPI